MCKLVACFLYFKVSNRVVEGFVNVLGMNFTDMCIGDISLCKAFVSLDSLKAFSYYKVMLLEILYPLMSQFKVICREVRGFFSYFIFSI